MPRAPQIYTARSTTRNTPSATKVLALEVSCAPGVPGPGHAPTQGPGALDLGVGKASLHHAQLAQRLPDRAAPVLAGASPRLGVLETASHLAEHVGITDPAAVEYHLAVTPEQPFGDSPDLELDAHPGLARVHQEHGAPPGAPGSSRIHSGTALAGASSTSLWYHRRIKQSRSCR